jgi:restriction system protein
MAVPDFQSCMLPLMQFAADGQEHTSDEATETLAQQFQLTKVERKERLPSGKQYRFDNRVGWARTYLQKALLLERTGRSKFQITPRGTAVLQQNPTVINVTFLEQFPEFKEFKQRTNPQGTISIENQQVPIPPTKTPQPQSVKVSRLTPQEVLDTSYQEMRRILAIEILDQVMVSSPARFEKLVVDLLLAMGYGGSRTDAGRTIGRSGDEGIDGTINEDRLGLDIVYIQAKRWQNSVGRPDIQAFVGSLEGQRANKGVFITTSQFTKEAREYVTKIGRKVVLLDGDQLTQFMIDYSVGVTTVETYTVKRVDSDYFNSD